MGKWDGREGLAAEIPHRSIALNLCPVVRFREMRFLLGSRLWPSFSYTGFEKERLCPNGCLLEEADFERNRGMSALFSTVIIQFYQEFLQR